MPGLVSTLLNQAYSMPGRLVQTFLQVTLHVWQPMHLSRFSTIAICARIFMGPPEVPAQASGCGRSGSWALSLRLHDRDLLGADRRIEPVDLAHLAHDDEFVAIGPERPVIVEAVPAWRIAAEHVRRPQHDARHRAMDRDAHAGDRI